MPPTANVPDLETARRIAESAGLRLPDERLQVFAVALARNTDQAQALLALDYGRTEPAARFAAPPGHERR
jgi:hypothetical protein